MTPKEMRHQLEIERNGGLYSGTKRRKLEKKFAVRYPLYLINQAREQLKEQRSGDHCQLERFLSNSRYELHCRKLDVCDYYVFMDSTMVRYHKLGSFKFEIIKTKNHEEAISIIRFGINGDSKVYHISNFHGSTLSSPHYHINKEAIKKLTSRHNPLPLS